MATEVTIPNLGYTMTVAKILRFVKSVGDSVEAGETLFEIETDKVNYGIEAPVSGVVKAILRDEGDEVPVGGVVAIIGDRDEQVDLARYMGREGEGEGKAPEGERQEREVVSAARLEKGRVLASPVARKMARERGIDLTLIRGSGRSGRIRMADVERYLREVMTEGREIEAGPTFPEIAEVITMTSMRATIARRLSRSFREAPHFNLFTEVDMTEVNRLRESTGDSIEAQAGTRLSINDILIKGAALVLREFPLLNARLVDEKIEVLKDIHIGLAVALDEGLIVPAVEKADHKRLWQIARERKDLVDRARQGRLKLHEIERGTFTISNLGMYDVYFFTSILNPPQTGILSVGRIVERPVVRGGSIVIRPIADMSLAVDHRVVDGAVGARFLEALKRGLENPYTLL